MSTGRVSKEMGAGHGVSPCHPSPLLNESMFWNSVTKYCLHSHTKIGLQFVCLQSCACSPPPPPPVKYEALVFSRAIPPGLMIDDAWARGSVPVSKSESFHWCSFITPPPPPPPPPTHTHTSQGGVRAVQVAKSHNPITLT